MLSIISASRPSNDVQIRAFTEQIRIARTKQLPIVIHSKNSFVPILEILCKV